MSQLYWDMRLRSFAGYAKSFERAMNNSLCFMKVRRNLGWPHENSFPCAIQLHLPGVTSVPMVHSFLRSSTA